MAKKTKPKNKVVAIGPQAASALLEQVANRVSKLAKRTGDARQLRSKRLAAFNLGYYSFAVRLWQCVAWEMFSDDLSRGMQQSVFKISQALTILADETNASEVLPQIQQQLREIAALHRTMRKQFRAATNAQVADFSAQAAPGSDLCSTLQALVASALDADGPLTYWRNLGAAIGRFQLHLQLRQAGDDLPEIRPLIDQLRLLPHEAIRAIPALTPILDRTGNLRRGAVLQLLADLVGVPPAAGPDALAPLVLGWTWKLVEDLHYALLGFDIAPEFRPSWNRATGELRVGQQVVRMFRGNARNQGQILDALEGTGWPTWIDNPLTGGDPKRQLNNTLRDLNKDIEPRLIHFHADGTGNGLGWTLLDSAATLLNLLPSRAR